MIDVLDIRQCPEKVWTRALQPRGQPRSTLDEAVRLDLEWRQGEHALQELHREQKRLTSAIKASRRAGAASVAGGSGEAIDRPPEKKKKKNKIGLPNACAKEDSGSGQQKRVASSSASSGSVVQTSSPSSPLPLHGTTLLELAPLAKVLGKRIKATVREQQQRKTKCDEALRRIGNYIAEAAFGVSEVSAFAKSHQVPDGITEVVVGVEVGHSGSPSMQGSAALSHAVSPAPCPARTKKRWVECPLSYLHHCFICGDNLTTATVPDNLQGNSNSENSGKTTPARSSVLDNGRITVKETVAAPPAMRQVDAGHWSGFQSAKHMATAFQSDKAADAAALARIDTWFPAENLPAAALPAPLDGDCNLIPGTHQAAGGCEELAYAVAPEDSMRVQNWIADACAAGIRYFINNALAIETDGLLQNTIVRVVARGGLQNASMTQPTLLEACHDALPRRHLEQFSSRTLDVQVGAIGSKFQTILSIANATDFIARELALRFGFPKMGQMRKAYVHTLHCRQIPGPFWKRVVGMASTRTVQPTAETNKQPGVTLRKQNEFFSFLAWDLKFAAQSYIDGFELSSRDFDVHDSLKSCAATFRNSHASPPNVISSQFPHLARWFRHIESFSSEERDQVCKGNGNQRHYFLPRGIVPLRVAFHVSALD